MGNVLLKTDLIDSAEKIKIQRNSQSSEEHSHDFLELVYVASGKAEQVVDGEKQVISAGDCFLIDIGMQHGYVDTSDDFCVINCLFLPSFLSSVTADDTAFKELACNVFASITSSLVPTYLFVSSGSAMGLGELFARMLDEYVNKGTAYLEALQSLLKVVLIAMFRSCGKQGQPQLIGDVIEYVRRSAGKKVKIEDLSEAMFFSPSYISRLFKRHTGRNLNDFIREARMQSVCKSLIETKDSVDKIIFDHGYSDKKGFYEQFNRLYGCTPAQYRRNFSK